MSTKTTHNAVQDAEAVKRLFGECPEGVLAPMNIAADGFGWLAEIFQAIRALECDRSAKPGNAFRIARLAALGAYLAEDLDNTMGCEYERMLEGLTTAGLVPNVDNRYRERVMAAGLVSQFRGGES